MSKLLLALAMFLLITIGDTRKLYYPDTKDPHAIVFEGPTNFKEPDTEAIPDTSENEVQDYSKLIDVRFGDNKCPEGYEMVGEVCFPND